MKNLSPEAQAILDAARDVDNPTPEDRDRVKRAVLSAVAASSAAVVTATAASKAAASAATTGAATTSATATGVAATTAATAGSAGAAAAGITGLGAVTAKALVTLSIVGASVGVAVSKPWEPSEPVAVASSVAVETEALAVTETEAEAEAKAEAEAEAETVAEAEAEPVTEAEAEAEAAAETEADAESEVVVAVRETPRRIAVPNSAQVDTHQVDDAPAPDTLAAELALLRQANVALSRGDHAAALAALNEHAANFPRGVMIAERNGTRALVLCASGAPGSRESAQRFLDTHPRSPIAQRIRDNCLE